MLLSVFQCPGKSPGRRRILLHCPSCRGWETYFRPKSHHRCPVLRPPTAPTASREQPEPFLDHRAPRRCTRPPLPGSPAQLQPQRCLPLPPVSGLPSAFPKLSFPDIQYFLPPLRTLSSVTSPGEASLASLLNTGHSLSTSASSVPGTRAGRLKLLDGGTGLVSFAAGQVTQPLAHSRYSISANRLTSGPLTFRPKILVSRPQLGTEDPVAISPASCTRLTLVPPWWRKGFPPPGQQQRQRPASGHSPATASIYGALTVCPTQDWAAQKPCLVQFLGVRVVTESSPRRRAFQRPPCAPAFVGQRLHTSDSAEGTYVPRESVSRRGI